MTEGLISAAAARTLYGVVMRGNLSLDEKATAALRKRLGSAVRNAKTKRGKTNSRPKRKSR